MFYSARSQTIAGKIVGLFHVNESREEKKRRLDSVSPEEFESCVEYARANGLLAHFIRSVKELGYFPHLQAETRDALEKELKECERKSAVHLRDCEQVVFSLQNAGIDSLALKGIALIHMLYRKPGIRPMRDLDLLLQGAQINDARKILSELGFSVIRGTDEPDHHLPRMVKTREDGSSFAIDVHHRLVPPRVYGIKVGELEGVWSRSSWFHTDEGRKIRTLSYEDHLLHLHIHLFHHIFYNFRLMHLIDIVLAFRDWKGKFDLGFVADELDKIGLFRFRMDLWSWINDNFGDSLSPGFEKNDGSENNSGRWLMQHGSLPLFKGLRYTNSFTEWGACLYHEFYRSYFRTLWAPEWGILNRQKTVGTKYD